jgi:hypothetical protein
LTVKITIGKSGAYTAPIENVKTDACVDFQMNQKNTLTTMGFKSFWSARNIIAGIETMHMIRVGAEGLPQRQNHACSQLVLQHCSLFSNSATQLFLSPQPYCD